MTAQIALQPHSAQAWPEKSRKAMLSEVGKTIERFEDLDFTRDVKSFEARKAELSGAYQNWKREIDAFAASAAGNPALTKKLRALSASTLEFRKLEEELR
jgi:hypothetical protein